MYKQVTEAADQQGAVRFNGKVKEIKVYFATGFTKGRPYMVANDALGIKGVALATSATVPRFIVFPQGDTTATAGWYWCALEGTAQVMVDGTVAVAAGDLIEVLNAGVACIEDHATTFSIGSLGVALSAQAVASAVLTSVYLFGKAVNIAAV